MANWKMLRESMEVVDTGIKEGTPEPWHEDLIVEFHDEEGKVKAIGIISEYNEGALVNGKDWQEYADNSLIFSFPQSLGEGLDAFETAGFGIEEVYGQEGTEEDEPQAFLGHHGIHANEVLENYSAEDLVDIANSKMGWAVAEQLKSILDGENLYDQNPNALKYIAEFAADKGEMALADELNEFLSGEFYGAPSEGMEEMDVVGGNKFDDLWDEVVDPRDKKRIRQKGGYPKTAGGKLSPVGSTVVKKHHFFDDLDETKEGSDSNIEGLFKDGKQAGWHQERDSREKKKKGDNEDGQTPLFPHESFSWLRSLKIMEKKTK